MKHKVGDKVQIKSIDWYNKNKDSSGIICDNNNNIIFTKLMARYCGKSTTIVRIVNCDTHHYYRLSIDSDYFYWTDEMFEENIKDMETKEIILPNGWEVDKIENGKIILKESKKKELPKTWEECLEILKSGEYINGMSIITPVTLQNFSDTAVIRNKNILPKDIGKPMLALCQLLICRDVYRQGWKPDWTDNTTKYCIEFFNGMINNHDYRSTSKTLSFQSKEIRDEFSKNFKDLIKKAKELI